MQYLDIVLAIWGRIHSNPLASSGNCHVLLCSSLSSKFFITSVLSTLPTFLVIIFSVLISVNTALHYIKSCNKMLVVMNFVGYLNIIHLRECNTHIFKKVTTIKKYLTVTDIFEGNSF